MLNNWQKSNHKIKENPELRVFKKTLGDGEIITRDDERARHFAEEEECLYVKKSSKIYYLVENLGVYYCVSKVTVINPKYKKREKVAFTSDINEALKAVKN